MRKDCPKNRRRKNLPDRTVQITATAPAGRQGVGLQFDAEYGRVTEINAVRRIDTREKYTITGRKEEAGVFPDIYV